MAIWTRPTYADRLRDQQAELIWRVLWFALFAQLLALVVTLPAGSHPALAAAVQSGALAATSGALLLVRSGRLRVGAGLLVAGLFAAFVTLVLVTGSIRHAHSAGFLVVVTLARVTLGARVANVAAVASAVTLAGASWLGDIGRLGPGLELAPLDEVVSAGVLLSTTLAIISITSLFWERTIERERAVTDLEQARAAQAEALARLGVEAVATPSADLFAGQVVRALAQSAGAREALIVRSTGPAEAAAHGLDPAVLPAVTRVVRELLLEPGALPPKRIEGLGEHLVALPIEGHQQPSGLVCATFTSADAARRAVPFVATATSLLSTVVERDHQRAEFVRLQKFDVTGRLAASVSHEFNNLLAVILGGASTIAETGAGPQRELAEEIVAAARRGALLTGRLLTVARKQVTNRERLDLTEAVQRFRPLLSGWVPPSVQLELEPAGVPLPLELDRAELEQMLDQLCSNAVASMPHGGRLTLRTLRAGDGADAAFEVIDTGSGMTEEARSRLFEPFFSTRPDAAGLGLSTVAATAKRCGGSIEVDSAPGRGTRVQVRLPLAVPAPAPASVVPRPATARTCVLVVDDDQLVRRTVVRVLERNGLSSLEAGDGEEALMALAAHPDVSLVLTDVVMPRLGGLGLGRRVQADFHLPVVLMSGYADSLAGSASPFPFVAKPFTPGELMIVVRAALGEPAHA